MLGHNVWVEGHGEQYISEVKPNGLGFSNKLFLTWESIQRGLTDEISRYLAFREQLRSRED